MNPILIAALIALLVAVYAAAAAIGSHYGYKIGMKESEVEHKALQADYAIATAAFTELDTMHQKTTAENTNLHKDLQGTRATIKARDIEMDALHGEKMQLHAQNADLREALQEAKVEIKALQMNTIEVPEVTPAPMAYAQAKPSIDKAAQTSRRTTRKKAGQA